MRYKRKKGQDMVTLAIENKKAIIIQEDKYQDFLAESKKHKISADIINRGRIFNAKLSAKQK